MSTPSLEKSPLTLDNFRQVVSDLTKGHKQQIRETSNKFKVKVENLLHQQEEEETEVNQPVAPVQTENRASLFSDQDEEAERNAQTRQGPPSPQPQPRPILREQELGEWNPGRGNDLKDYQALVKHYEEVFKQRKMATKGSRSGHDFRMEEKEMLTDLFHEIKDEEKRISFEAIVKFFRQCQLFYLCYNIKPYHLLDTIKDHAHRYKDRLVLEEFLHFFQVDRANVTSLERDTGSVLARKCVLSQSSWTELKSIFTTLDTFGNESVSMTPFLHKIKTSFNFSHLLNEPAIYYHEINRTIPLKKIIFTLQNRHRFKPKVTWHEIKSYISHFNFVAEPTIDHIYGRMIARGQIDMKSNYFMVGASILDQIKHIYHRCPKYCEYFVKTKFIVGQLLESKSVKEEGRDEVVRVIKNGRRQRKILLEQQVREIGNKAHNYIDLDELLEYFSIKGPINTAPDNPKSAQDDSSSDEEHEAKLYELSKIRSSDKLRQIKKYSRGYRPVRHLTVCEEFKLSKREKESTMERKTRLWKEQQAKEEDKELKLKFKANPIPAELNPQRYQAYLQAKQEEKLHRKEQQRLKKAEQNRLYQYLKSNTKLFSKKAQPQQPQRPKSQFHAAPIPWFIGQTDMLVQREAERKMQRKKNLTEKKIALHRTWNKLPGVMMYNQKDDKESHHSHELVKTQKSIGFKHKPVPNFQSMHQKFQAELASKKQKFTPTRPVEFRFTEHHPRKTRAQNTSQDQSRVMTRKRSLPHVSAADRRSTVQDIPMTVKFSQMVAHTHKRLEKEQEEKERQLMEQKERKAKQDTFARFMRKQLKKSLHKSGSLKQMVKYKTVKLRQEWDQLRRNNEEELCNMYSNVMARPFLFEAQSMHKSNTTHVPLKKQSKAFKQSRHVHESPLKAFEPENNEESPNMGISPHQVAMGMEWEEEENVPSYVNQSF